jgi:endonuclease/exonuclease/phosphatase family metal-dependent hydrolase
MKKKIKYIFITIFFMSLLCFVGILWSLFSHRLPWQHTQETNKQITVLTYNTQALAINEDHKGKMQMLDYINSLDADIVCLQEVLVYKDPKRLTLPKLREAMRKYPYTYYDFKLYNSKRQFGNVVFSRYPLINKETIRYTSHANISSQCDVIVKGDTIRLMVNHLESFHLSEDELNMESINSNPLLGKKILRASSLRRQQAKTLCHAIDQSPHPVIAVGDFNSLPFSWVYWRMNLGMHDCWAETSFGQYGSTYHHKNLHARIDYIFTSTSLQPIACKVDKASYSDHYPVIATIGW